MANRSVTVALIVFVAANLVVAAAWIWREQLVEAGVPLPAASLPSKVVLPAQPLPPVAGQGDAVAGVEAVAETLPVPATPAATPVAQTRPPPEPSVAAATPGTALDGTDAAPECMLAGPFTGRDSAARMQEVVEAVEAEGGEADIEAVRPAPRYLVHLAPAASRAAADLARDELAAHGVHAYVMGGERRNGVSVGVFSTPERAAAQRDRVAGLGYDDVRVSKAERPAERYRLRVYGVAPALLGDTAWEPCPGADVDRDGPLAAQ